MRLGRLEIRWHRTAPDLIALLHAARGTMPWYPASTTTTVWGGYEWWPYPYQWGIVTRTKPRTKRA